MKTKMEERERERKERERGREKRRKRRIGKRIIIMVVGMARWVFEIQPSTNVVSIFVL